MPVYEFYCRDCHTIFNFISRRVNTSKRPCCPCCGRPGLERQVSRFAISRGLEEKGDEEFPALDDEAMERAMNALAGEMDQADEKDPRSLGRLMRRFTEVTGMSLGEAAEEAMRRLEAGEDPEQVEAELGDLLDGESPFGGERLQGLKKRAAAPRRDETLYPLD